MWTAAEWGVHKPGEYCRPQYTSFEVTRAVCGSIPLNAVERTTMKVPGLIAIGSNLRKRRLRHYGAARRRVGRRRAYQSSEGKGRPFFACFAAFAPAGRARVRRDLRFARNLHLLEWRRPDRSALRFTAPPTRADLRCKHVGAETTF